MFARSDTPRGYRLARGRRTVPCAADLAPPYPNDDGLLLNQLPRWVPDAALRRKILVDNPGRLYGFEATTL